MQGRHPEGPQPAMLSCWSGQKGRYNPLLRLQPPPCSTQLCQASRDAGLSLAPLPWGVPLALKYQPALASPGFGAAGKFLRCLTLPPQGEINLQQWNIILQVCEGMDANAAGEKGAAPEEGLGGFPPACQTDLLLPPPKSLGASSSGCQQHGHQPAGTERRRDVLGGRQV